MSNFNSPSAGTDPQGSGADVEIQLCRAPLWRGGLSVASAGAAVLLASSLFDVAPKLLAGRALDPESWLSLILVAMWLAVLAAIFGRRLWVRRTPMPAIVFRADAVELPEGPESTRARRVAYQDILTVGQTERPFVSGPWPQSRQGGPVAGARGRKAIRAWHHFFLESRKRIYSLPQPMFVEADGHEVFFRELQQRIGALPEGTSALLATERARRPALAAMGRRPWATQAIFGVAAVFFLNTWLKGSLDAPFGLLRWGAMAPALVGHRGEVYRLLAATFLHGHWLHAAMNGLALSYLGTLLERLLGWQRMLLLYLVSGFVAMAASAWAADALMSVGASGALFGLLGAFAVLSWRLGPALPLGVRQPPRWWGTLLVVNALVPAFWPVVDWVAHVAGFCCGAVVMATLLGRGRSLPKATSKFLTGVACVVVACYGAALVVAVAQAARTSAAGETRIAKLLLRDPRTPAATLHNFALLWAIDPASTPEHLEAGRACAAEALKRAPQVPDYRATLAELERLLGDAPAACNDWRLAVHEVADQLPWRVGPQLTDTLAARYATQYALNLAAHLPVPAPQPLPSPTAAPEPQGLRVAKAQDGGDPLRYVSRSGRAWTLHDAPTLVGAPRELWLLGRNGDEPVALLQVVLAANAEADWSLPTDLTSMLEAAGAQTLQVAYAGEVAQMPPTNVPCPTGCWRAWRLPVRRDPGR